MSLIKSYLSTACTIVSGAKSKLAMSPSKPSIEDMISHRDRLERQLSGLPSYAQEGIQEELDKLNEELRKAIEADYEARWNSIAIDDVFNMSKEDMENEKIRKDILQNIHEQVAAELGIDPLKLQFSDLTNPSEGDLIGIYNDEDVKRWWFDTDEKIRIDIKNVWGIDEYNNFDNLRNTVVHETYHQYQEYLVNNPDERPPHISEEKIAEWKDNFDNYIEYEDDPIGYYNQPLEADARAYAENHAKNFYENKAEN